MHVMNAKEYMKKLGKIDLNFDKEIGNDCLEDNDEDDKLIKDNDKDNKKKTSGDKDKIE